MNISSIFVSEQNYHGYGNIGLHFQKWMRELGVTLLPHDSFGWDWLIAYSPPRATYVGPSYRPDMILHTMYEARPVPQAWVDIMNRVGRVWVPSQWCYDLFREYGVHAPMFTAGYGYDPDLYQPIDRTGRTSPLKVLVWADVMVSRKRVMRSIETFLEADIPGATLEVKINDSFFRNAPVLREDGSVAENIRLISQPLSREELVRWLEAGDVLLYLSGGEGFGLQPMEAMATGLPVIAMRQSGMTEFMTPGSVLEVPSLGLETAPSLTAIHKEPVYVYEPDLDAAIAHLRWAAANRDALAVQGMAGYEAVKHRTWEWATRHVVAQLESFGGI